MNKALNLIKKEVYDKCRLRIANFTTEEESQEYEACRFDLNEWKIVSRKAKTTPKKAGQFVTFWKRNANGIIEPLYESDQIDFYVVTVKTATQLGQFVFPKAILIKKGIISTAQKEGKRGFRVYPAWDETKNKQATKTQNWQLNYFYKVDEKTDFNSIITFFNQ